MQAWLDTNEAHQRDARRERVVRQSVREVMARRGIPSDWLGCDVVPASRSNGFAGLYVQLVVLPGGESLLPQMLSLQEAVRTAAVTLDPHAGGWIFGITWVFTDNDALMQPPADWQLPPRAAQVAR